MDVGAWLRGLGLGQYERMFRDNDIDAGLLPTLTADDLRELGIASLGHRKRLLAAIAALAPPADPQPSALPRASPPPPAAAESQAERRQLTVMFADLVDSTALANRLDPEDMREVIRAYQDAAAREITRFEGHIAKFMGDGVLAYFGWPQAQEDAAERAVRAGLAFAAAVAALEAPGGGPLATRIGIATGLVVVGELTGTAEARERAVVGETPNLAARLQVLAEPGAVVVAEGTRRLLGDLFAYRDLGATLLKGFAAPVRAFAVLGAGAAEGRFEALHAAGVTPLVGREREAGLLLDRWAAARGGEGQVVLPSGDPGIGKSRLVQALRERLAGEPHVPWRCQCSPHHQTSALRPLADCLERAAGFTRDDSPERRLDKLEALLPRAVADVAGAAPLLAALLAIPVAGRYPPLDLTPQRQKQKTLEVLFAQLAGLAERRPVFLIFEDAHWSDPSSLEFLGLVVEHVRRVPALVIITSRPGFAPPWAGHAHVTPLELGRLERRQAVTIAEQLAGKALPVEVVNEIAAKTDGVPLFVEELTKAVLESGLLADEGDHYTLAGPLPRLAIPATLQDSLMARLDRLAPARKVAQIGAAIGREFSHELLAAVLPLPAAELAAALDQLVGAELVFRRGTPPRAAYTFKHALVQEVAYRTLLRRERKQLHALIASVLETRFPETAEREPELLAHHFTEAGLVEPAVVYWRRAGERSGSVEAIARLSRGLELVKTLPETPKRAEEELQLWMAIAVPLIATRGYPAPEVERAYARALELCDRFGRSAELFPVLRGLWNCYFVRCELERARGLAERLVSLAEEHAEPVRRALARRALGSTLFFLGRLPEAAEQLEEGIAIDDALAASAGDRSSLVLYGERAGLMCRLYSAWNLWFMGFPGRALERAEAGLALARDLSHAHSVASALAFATTLHDYRREFAAALRRADAGLEIAAEHGLPLWLHMSTVGKGFALASLGRHAEGVAQIRAGHAAYHGIGARLGDTHWLGFLAAAEAAGGRTGEGLAVLDRAAEVAAATGESHYLAELHRLRGALLLEAGEPGGGEAYLLEAVRCARGQATRSLELRAATSLARLWRDQGRRAEARDLLAPVHGWFTEGFDTPDLVEANALLEEL